MSDDALAAAIRALWDQSADEQRAFARRLRAAAVEARDEPTDLHAWEQVQALAHRLAGTLGSLGQVTAGAAAVELEDLVSAPEPPTPVTRRRAVDLADRIVDTLDAH